MIQICNEISLVLLKQSEWSVLLGNKTLKSIVITNEKDHVNIWLNLLFLYKLLKEVSVDLAQF